MKHNLNEKSYRGIFEENNKNHLFFKLSEIGEKDLKKLDREELEFLVKLGKLSNSILGYPLATLTSTGGSNTDHYGDKGRILLMGISPGMGKEFIDNASCLGGMGLAALLGFSEISENLGTTALLALALGGMLGMTLLPPPGMFGNYVGHRMALGHYFCSTYMNAKPLSWGDNLESGNAFLAEGPFGTSAAGTMLGLLSGAGRIAQKGETCICPGAFLGFCGNYGFY